MLLLHSITTCRSITQWESVDQVPLLEQRLGLTTSACAIGPVYWVPLPEQASKQLACGIATEPNPQLWAAEELGRFAAQSRVLRALRCVRVCVSCSDDTSIGSQEKNLGQVDPVPGPNLHKGAGEALLARRLN